MKQPSDIFVKGIELLDFQIGHSSAGNVLLISEITDPAISPAEVFALEQASYYQADAVYFRRFEDNRPALSQIFIYDNSHNQIANGEEAAIHRNLWSAGIVALFLIIDKSRVRIYDCRKPVESFMGQISSSPLEVLDFGSDALHKYSARLFDNGAFWESAASTGNFLEEESAFHKLIAGLKKIRNAFLLKSGLPEATAHKLLVQRRRRRNAVCERIFPFIRS